MLQTSFIRYLSISRDLTTLKTTIDVANKNQATEVVMHQETCIKSHGVFYGERNSNFF